MSATSDGMIFVLGAGKPYGRRGAIKRPSPWSSKHTLRFGALVYAIATNGKPQFISWRTCRVLRVLVGSFLAPQLMATTNARPDTECVDPLPRVRTSTHAPSIEARRNAASSLTLGQIFDINIIYTI